MKKVTYYLAFLSSLCISFYACKDKEDTNPTFTGDLGNLSIRFVPKYEGQILALSNPITPKGSMPIQIQGFSFFATLEDATANVTDNTDNITMVRFDNLTDTQKATEGIVKQFSIKVGDYNTLNLGIGVPKNLNEKQPNKFVSSHPLSELADYWSAWDSYIFSKVEGRVDTTAAQKGRFDLGYSYHTGTDEMYRSIKLARDFSIKKGQNTEITIEVDAALLLNGKSGKIDIIKNPNTHSLKNKDIATTIVNNYASAFSIK